MKRAAAPIRIIKFELNGNYGRVMQRTGRFPSVQIRSDGLEVWRQHRWVRGLHNAIPSCFSVDQSNFSALAIAAGPELKADFCPRATHRGFAYGDWRSALRLIEHDGEHHQHDKEGEAEVDCAGIGTKAIERETEKRRADGTRKYGH